MLYRGWQVRREFELDHTRILSAFMVNTSMGAPKRPVKPRDLFALPEIDGVPKQTTPDRLEALRQRMSRRLGRDIQFMKVA